MSDASPTPRQRAALDAASALDAMGVPPTDEEVGRRLGITASAAYLHRKTLEARGLWPFATDFRVARSEATGRRFREVADRLVSEGKLATVAAISREIGVTPGHGSKILAQLQAAGEWPHPGPAKSGPRSQRVADRAAAMLARAREVAAEGRVPVPSEVGPEAGVPYPAYKYVAAQLRAWGRWPWPLPTPGRKAGPPRQATPRPARAPRPPRALAPRPEPSLGGPDPATVPRRKRRALIAKMWRSIQAEKRAAARRETYAPTLDAFRDRAGLMLQPAFTGFLNPMPAPAPREEDEVA